MKLRNKIMMGTLALFVLAGISACATPHVTKIHPPVNSKDRVYSVTIRNITHGMTFTNFIVASHNMKYKMFELGDVASDALEHLAEAGDLSVMETSMVDSGNVHDIVKTNGLLAPGQSVTVQIKTNMRMSFVSLAAMGLPLHDGFAAINATNLHHSRSSKVVFSVMYDAGSEINTERCKNIPGNIVCDGTGEGYNPVGGEGHIHIHQGTHELADIPRRHWDFRNPVLQVEFHRVK